MLRYANYLSAFLILAAALCAVASAPQARAATDLSSSYPKLFGSTEIRSSKLAKFRKWSGVLARYQVEDGKKRRRCRITKINRCSIQQWHVFLKKIESLPLREQLEEVNAYFNKLYYIVDPVNYGKKDYWATPLQFFSKNGDCEDYAISKYLSLRKLGVPVRNLRIVVLRDLNLKIAHAVLVVYDGGEALILDNQISQVVNASRIRHYQPIYSINEENWWLHRS